MISRLENSVEFNGRHRSHQAGYQDGAPTRKRGFYSAGGGTDRQVVTAEKARAQAWLVKEEARLGFEVMAPVPRNARESPPDPAGVETYGPGVPFALPEQTSMGIDRP